MPFGRFWCTAPNFIDSIGPYMLELWKLKRRRTAVQKAFEKDRAKLKASKAQRDEFFALDSQEYFEVREIERELDMEQSRLLFDQARALDVDTPTPADAEMWNSDNNLGRIWLTYKGRATVRKAIDEERARRFDVKTRWVTKLILPLLAGVIGIIGAITGLVAVLRHTK
jgi:hypothetical protein